MEENTFAQFTPYSDIKDENREQLKRYYMENNLSPDNDMLKKYLNWPSDAAIITSTEGTSKSTTPQVDIGKVLGNVSFTTPTSVQQTLVSNSTPVPTGPPPKNKKEFLEKYEAGAIEASRKSGISKDLLLAQVALETGWGKHAPGNNFGGIKAGKSWKGKKQELLTTEYENGKHVKKPQTFRAYDTPEEGFKGYVDFLMSNKRYHILKGISDPYKAAEAMGKTGYATDPNYTSSLQNIIKQIQST
jgi:flagellum-specific peptidoglycan hydrolase FlgJ